MNLLISKFDQVENSSEVENLIFELHSIKNQKSQGSLFKDRKTSLPENITNKNKLETGNVPMKLRKKIQKFIKNIEFKENTCPLMSQRDGTNSSNIEFQNAPLSSIGKREAPKDQPPSVKFIHEDSDLYLKYQDLCLYYEDARRKVQLKHLKALVDIKTPNKIEHNIGIVLLYLSSFLDTTTMLYSSNPHFNPKEIKLTNKSWKTIVTVFKKLSIKRIFGYLTYARREIETYQIGEGVVRELDKCVHSIPGMKYTTTSMHSNATKVLYEYCYQIYQMFKLFSEVFEKIDSVKITS